MNDPAGDEFLAKCVRQQRTIVLALLGGSTMMLVLFAVLHFVVFDGKALVPDLPSLTLVAASAAGAVIGFSFYVAESFRKQCVQRRVAANPAEDVGDLLLGWQTTTLVRSAMFEGAAVLSMVLFLVTADLAALGIAVAMIAMIAVGLPSEPTARRWLDRSREELDRKRGESTGTN